jgi:leucyl aminopeptidase
MTMRVQIDAGGIGEIRAETFVIPIARHGESPSKLPQGLSSIDRRMGGRLSDTLAAGDFKAGAGDRLAIYGPRDGDIVRCILLGLGEAEKVDDEALRALGGRAGREAVRSNVGRVALVIPPGHGLAADRSAQLVAEGAMLGAYRFDRYQTAKASKTSKGSKASKTPKPRLRSAYTRKARDLARIRAEVRKTVQIAESQILARDLSNEPPNAIYPESLAREARRMARAVGLRVAGWGRSWLSDRAACGPRV